MKGDVPLDFSEQTKIDLIRWINTCNRRKDPITGRLNDVLFEVDEKDPFKISFKKGEDYYAIIKGDDMYSEVTAFRESFSGQYTNSEGVTVSAGLIQSVCVVDGEEITENCNITLTDTGTKGKKRIGKIAEGMVAEVLSEGSGYQERPLDLKEKLKACGPGKECREFFRSDIDPNEKIRKMGNRGDEGPSFLSQFSFPRVIESLQNSETNVEMTYGNCIPQAKKFEKTCRQIYDLFMEAYRIAAHKNSSTFNKYKGQNGINNDELLELIAKHSREGNIDVTRKEIEGLVPQVREADGIENGEGEEH